MVTRALTLDLQVADAVSYLQVPDLDLRVHGSCPENEPIRVELCTGESCGGKEMGLWSKPPGEEAQQMVGCTFPTLPSSRYWQ